MTVTGDGAGDGDGDGGGDGDGDGATEGPTGRVFVLRHGETAWSRDGRHTSRTEIDLTERGRAQARQAGRLLDVLRGADAPAPTVWCSPRRRARETAERAGLRVDAVREDLTEWGYGTYEGRRTPDIRTEDPGWTIWTHAVPGGESATEVGARLDRVLADAAAVLTGSDLVVVGHGHAGRVLVARHLGLAAAAGVGFALDAAAVTVLGRERGAPRVDLLNVPGTILGR